MRREHRTRPAGHRLRKARHSVSGGIYLLTTATVNRVPTFVDLLAARAVVRALHQDARAAKTLAYVVMPDHLHWLVQLADGVALGWLMQRVKARSSFAVNRCIGRSGALWQRGYHDHAIRRDEELVEVAPYVVLNPVRAGIVDRVWDYAHWDAIWV